MSESSQSARPRLDWHANPVSTPSRAPTYEISIVAVLFLWNLAVNLLIPDAGSLPTAAVGIVVLLYLARRAGSSWDSLGLDGLLLGNGLRVGVTAFALIGLAVTATALSPPVRELLADQRFIGVETSEMLYETLLRIPFATALGEEVAFRGVLLGVLLAWFSPFRAAIMSSALFGLWHVLPGITALETSTAADPASGLLVTITAVAGQMVITAIAGMLFAWLRFRSGSVAAPVLAHWGINGTAYAAGWLIVRNSWT